ncbi:MAG: Asp23/Gls24 family envelope stress response protein [Gaiellaceae bacterium]
MKGELVLAGPKGETRVPPGTLAQIVIQATERVEGAQLRRRPRRSLAIEVDGTAASVAIGIVVPYGTVLPQLARKVQNEVRQALVGMCGIEVERVDVTVEALS